MSPLFRQRAERRPHLPATALLWLLIALPGSAGRACTIVVKADREVILAGNNEDYLEPRTKVWFFPAGNGAHGRVIWGFDRQISPYQGGMNDHGLFVDINAVGFTGCKDQPQKPDLPGDEIEYFLSRCTTVEDAIRVFRDYDVALGDVKFVFADALGSSAIVEWLDGKPNVIRRQGDFQVSTNYTSPLEHTEPRNQISQKILGSQPSPTVELVRRALAASAFSAPFCQTLYSTICDLKQRQLYVYHFHNFEECVTFDLDSELSKGEAAYTIPSLFAVRPYSEELFLGGGGSQLGAKALIEFVAANGAEKGIARFQEMAAEKKSYRRYLFEEWVLRDAGLVLLSKGLTEEGIAILELNAEQFPQSWQAYYALAEACLLRGDVEEARRNYRLALEHEPDAVRVADIMKKLGTGKE